MPKKYPEHFRLPTDGTLRDYKIGRELGLVDAGEDILSTPADAVAIGDIRSKEVQETDRRLRETARGLSDAGYPVEGLSAVQIGIAMRMSLVTAPEELWVPEGDERQYLTVINGSIEDIPGAPLGVPVAHGCFSSNEVFTKLQDFDQHILRGYNIFGEPISYDRNGFETAVDRHEVLWHEAGIRAANVAISRGVQLDWRPVELKPAYRDFYRGEHDDGYYQNPDLPDWHLGYPSDQWQAVETNEFRLANFLREQ